MIKPPNRTAVLLASVLFLTFLAVAPSAKSGFTNWDDEKYVTDNPLAKNFTPSGIKKILTTSHHGLYKPAVILSFAAEYRFFGANPRPYHITNIVFHLCNTALVFTLLLMLTGSAPLAAVSALFFGIHPMHMESVAWITERKDMIYAFFFLCASVLYVRWVKNGGLAGYIMSGLCLALSLCAKPMGATLPAVLFLYDYLLGRKISRKTLADKIMFFAISGIFAVITMVLLKEASGIDSESYTLIDRVFFPFYGIAFYSLKMLFPFKLAALYVFPQKTNGLLPWLYYACPFIVLAGCALFWKYLRENKYAVFGTAFFLITVFPVLQWLPVGPAVAADRYTYIPFVGLFLPLGAWLLALGGKLRGQRSFPLFIVFCLLWTTSLIYLARERCYAWSNSLTLWEDTITKIPPNAGAFNNMGVALIGENRLDEAVIFFMAAMKTEPDNPQHYTNLAGAYYKKGDKTRAEELLNTALDKEPAYAPAIFNLGRMYAIKGDYKKARAMFLKAIEIAPSREQAYMNMGNICRIEKNYKEAMAYYGKALEINPYSGELFFNMAQAYAQSGDMENAGQCLKKAQALGFAVPAGLAEPPR